MKTTLICSHLFHPIGWWNRCEKRLKVNKGKSLLWKWHLILVLCPWFKAGDMKTPELELFLKNAKQTLAEGHLISNEDTKDQNKHVYSHSTLPLHCKFLMFSGLKIRCSCQMSVCSLEMLAYHLPGCWHTSQYKWFPSQPLHKRNDTWNTITYYTDIHNSDNKWLVTMIMCLSVKWNLPKTVYILK